MLKIEIIFENRRFKLSKKDKTKKKFRTTIFLYFAQLQAIETEDFQLSKLIKFIIFIVP